MLFTLFAMEGGEEGAAEEEAAYQAISAKETTDLRALMQVLEMYIVHISTKKSSLWSIPIPSPI